MARDGGRAALSGNLENAPLSLFVDGGGGDLHLAADAVDALDRGAVVEPGGCDRDIDGERRDEAPDIGADERPASPVGDLDGSGIVDIADAMLALEAVAGKPMTMEGKMVPEGGMGLNVAVYILQKVAGLR
jgi:hypothetical protein